MSGTAENPEVMPAPEEQPDTTGLEVVRAAAAHELAAASVAARERGEIEARVALALARPRNMAKAKKEVMDALDDASFADVALWERPVGSKPRVGPDGRRVKDANGKDIYDEEIRIGPSVELARLIAVEWGNLYTTSQVTLETDDARHVRVVTMDVEKNTTKAVEFVLPKTMERQKLRRFDVPLRIRSNSQGQSVYIVAADPGQLDIMQRAKAAIAERNTTLQLIRKDFVDACVEKAIRICNEAAGKDREAVVKKSLDAFGKRGVSAEQLEAVLGKPRAEWNSEDLARLRRTFQAIIDGELTVEEFIGPAKVDGKPAPGATRAEQVKAAVTGAPTTLFPAREKDREPGED